MEYINYQKELHDYLKLHLKDVGGKTVAELQEGYEFLKDWLEAKPEATEQETSRVYANSPQFFKQARFRQRRMVLYRRILKEFLDRSGKNNEFHGKLFAPYSIQTVLDHGCGIGDIGLMLASVGYKVSFSEVIDVEGTSVLLDFLQWRLKRRYLKADHIFNQTQLMPNRYFDAIVSIEVMEHVWNVRNTLENLWQALKPGGMLFMIYEWGERKYYKELPQFEKDIVNEFLEEKFEKKGDFVWRKK